MRLYFLILDNESGEVIVDWFQLGQKFVRENVGSLKLHAWSLSANRSEIESFRRTLPDTQLKQGDRLPDKFMTPNGKFFSIGVCKGKFILSRPLLRK